jgi:ATP-binding cassette, subfamily C, bacterial
MKNSHKTFAILTRLTRRYIGYVVLSALGLIIVGLFEGVSLAALLPLLTIVLKSTDAPSTPVHDVFNAVLDYTGLPATVGTMLIFITVLVVGKAAISLLTMRQVAYAAAHVAADTRLRLIRATMAARWSHYVSLPSGALSNAIGVEAQRTGQIYNTGIKMISQGVQASIYLLVALSISWHVTLAGLAVGGVILFLLSGLIKMTQRAGHEQTQVMTSFTSRLVDGLAGMKPLKSMGGESRLGPLLAAEIERLKEVARRLTMLMQYVSILQEMIMMAVLMIGIYLLLDVWQQSLEALMVTAFLFSRTIGSINAIQRSVQNIASSEAAFLLVEDMTANASAAKEEPGGRLQPHFEHKIVFDQVTFGFGNHMILDHVSFTIPAGQFVSITGPSGVGKTTTTDLIVGLYQPQSGAVRIDDVDLRETDYRAWRQTIGYVPQEAFLFHDSVLINVTLEDPALSRADAEDALHAAGALDFVQAMPDGIDSVVGERGGRLSGGQRQRIMIARALARKPRLLILDEATTALDTKTEAAIIAELRKLSGQITILALSHQPAMIEAADVVFLLRDKTIHNVLDRNLGIPA